MCACCYIIILGYILKVSFLLLFSDVLERLISYLMVYCSRVSNGGIVDVSHGEIAIWWSHYQQGLHLIEGPASSGANMSPQEVILFMRGR